MPFLLRRVGGSDERVLVGEAFVEGGMYGEMVGENTEGEAEEVVIV